MGPWSMRFVVLPLFISLFPGHCGKAVRAPGQSDHPSQHPSPRQDRVPATTDDADVTGMASGPNLPGAFTLSLTDQPQLCQQARQFGLPWWRRDGVLGAGETGARPSQNVTLWHHDEHRKVSQLCMSLDQGAGSKRVEVRQPRSQQHQIGPVVHNLAEQVQAVAGKRGVTTQRRQIASDLPPKSGVGGGHQGPHATAPVATFLLFHGLPGN
jgi:hypothetical protein